jgi:hypothetical protein
LVTGLPDFSRRNIPKLEKIYHIATKLPNGHKMYQMAVLYSKWTRIYQPLSIRRPRKITQIWIFGLKRNHLATLVGNCFVGLDSDSLLSTKSAFQVCMDWGKK